MRSLTYSILYSRPDLMRASMAVSAPSWSDSSCGFLTWRLTTIFRTARLYRPPFMKPRHSTIHQSMNRRFHVACQSVHSGVARRYCRYEAAIFSDQTTSSLTSVAMARRNVSHTKMPKHECIEVTRQVYKKLTSVYRCGSDLKDRNRILQHHQSR